MAPGPARKPGLLRRCSSSSSHAKMPDDLVVVSKLLDNHTANSPSLQQPQPHLRPSRSSTMSSDLKVTIGNSRAAATTKPELHPLLPGSTDLTVTISNNKAATLSKRTSDASRHSTLSAPVFPLHDSSSGLPWPFSPDTHPCSLLHTSCLNEPSWKATTASSSCDAGPSQERVTSPAAAHAMTHPASSALGNWDLAHGMLRDPVSPAKHPDLDGAGHKSGLRAGHRAGPRGAGKPWSSTGRKVGHSLDRREQRPWHRPQRQTGNQTRRLSLPLLPSGVTLNAVPGAIREQHQSERDHYSAGMLLCFLTVFWLSQCLRRAEHCTLLPFFVRRRLAAVYLDFSQHLQQCLHCQDCVLCRLRALQTLVQRKAFNSQ